VNFKLRVNAVFLLAGRSLSERNKPATIELRKPQPKHSQLLPKKIRTAPAFWSSAYSKQILMFNDDNTAYTV